jgi:L-serine dehydratase
VLPVPRKAVDLLRYCTAENKKISEIVYEREKSMRSPEVIDHELMRIWDTMLSACTSVAVTEEYFPVVECTT